MGAMGYETGNVHLATPEQRGAILKDIKSRRGAWLEKAAEKMVADVQEDWKAWQTWAAATQKST
jgi:hypothetical protein